ncbi:SUL1 Sulfate permease 1 [Candida maltosa Xu316]|uniref:Putative high-affinity sulfate transporter n=1 Tax=Candida maltosa (strain Xu316) TaxID=1245528 RepID=M3J8I5_CANMX|nr:putative high-affinity sulfate transporter [Candida maltosa Xu316]
MAHNLLEKVKSITSNEGFESEVPHLYGEEYHPQQTRKSHEFHYDNQNAANHNNIYVPAYDEEQVTVLEWAQHVFGHPLQQIRDYLISLFPILQWILHYNWRWLYGDLVAGITVGVVLVPQSMSYAQLAGLEPQYGLYSSFVGVFIYSFFATSKDVSIGPVAVMSLQVSKVIAHVQNKFGDQYSGPEIATFLSLICGGIAAGIGLLRLGFILEFISIPAVMGFMTGSAFNIITGQVPGLMGYNSLVNTRASTYLVVVNTLKHLPDSTSDAAFGLIPLFILYLWKFVTEWGQKRWPRYKLWFFYTQQLRNAIVIIVATAISWGIVHPKKVSFHGSGKFKPPISVIGEVPRGLRHVGVMTIPDGIVGAMASEIPVSTVILLLEHIAIAKSFGRINDYKIVPDQEVIAIGVNNLIGTFFNAYPATGSFSRSALKAKCGVRTPLAGIFTGAVVLLALYALTSAFYYIPKATLCAVIIHAVSDLIANYKVTWSFWKMSPLDCGIFLISVILTVFVTIEAGIYFAIAASVVLLLFRVAMPQGQFLGKIQLAEVINPIIDHSHSSDDSEISELSGDNSSTASDVEIHQVLSKGSNLKSADDKEKSKIKDYKSTSENIVSTTGVLQRNNPDIKFHTRWVPLTKENINAGINVLPPPPGIIVFKPVESFTYPNSSKQVDRVSDEAKRLTRRGKPFDYSAVGSRPWNDPGPLRWNLPFIKKKVEVKPEDDNRPILRIVHFDFSTCASIDVTSIQALVDLRKALNAYADREVEFHFSGILSPWIRRGLLNAGFGTYEDGLLSTNNYVNIAAGYKDLELHLDEPYYAATGTNTPFFHLDIPNYT